MDLTNLLVGALFIGCVAAGFAWAAAWLDRRPSTDSTETPETDEDTPDKSTQRPIWRPGDGGGE